MLLRLYGKSLNLGHGIAVLTEMGRFHSLVGRQNLLFIAIFSGVFIAIFCGDIYSNFWVLVVERSNFYLYIYLA
jgi:hypothetical protein